MEIFSFVKTPTETNLLREFFVYKNILQRNRNPSRTTHSIGVLQKTKVNRAKTKN